MIDYNLQKNLEPKQELWLWGNRWTCNLERNPKKWTWRRLRALLETTIHNYTIKQRYKVALQQDNQQMNVDAELEAVWFNNKERAKFFNRIWHMYLPRKVSAMQWLLLTEGLPVGAWRERIGLPSEYPLCLEQERETIWHVFKDYTKVSKAWTLLNDTRALAGLLPTYISWLQINIWLMTTPVGPSPEDELPDTMSAFSINADTQWDILRVQLLWCQRVAHAFSKEIFHLGVVIWHAWRNTFYCAMEAYKELFRHNRNEKKRQEIISCFQIIWNASSIFGQLYGVKIKWNLMPHQTFFLKELSA